MNEPDPIIDPNPAAVQQILAKRQRHLTTALQWYAQGKEDGGDVAGSWLEFTGNTERPLYTLSQLRERHLVTYLRWYAAGNQDGGACARVAIEIAS